MRPTRAAAWSPRRSGTPISPPARRRRISASPAQPREQSLRPLQRRHFADEPRPRQRSDEDSSSFLQPGNNLSDVGSAATSRANLGLGALSTVTPGSGVAAAASNATNASGGFVTYERSARRHAVTSPTRPGFRLRPASRASARAWRRPWAMRPTRAAASSPRRSGTPISPPARRRPISASSRSTPRTTSPM